MWTVVVPHGRAFVRRPKKRKKEPSSQLPVQWAAITSHFHQFLSGPRLDNAEAPPRKIFLYNLALVSSLQFLTNRKDRHSSPTYLDVD